MEGDVALVTGGGAGIGRGIVTAFVELGAHVIVAEINADHCTDLEREFGSAVSVVECDVRRTGDMVKLQSAVDASGGRLDVLVNNVGHHLRMSAPFEDTAEEDWDRLYDINLRHMFVVTRAMIPGLRKSRRVASIINVSSIEGFRSFPGNVPYTAFKHAVTGFTRALALQLAPDGIRVNTLAPETTDTEQVPLDKVLDPALRHEADRTIPMGRFGVPRDHAGVAVFLATELSSWVTGSSVVVDGGGLVGGPFRLSPDDKWTNMGVVTDVATVKPRP
ncbi:hypothetical protein JI59_12655 [Novosphingobium pentaromativorans US6-1]|uniref:Short-chain dehydrogenase/reductase SDR n=2 Tax=Novosphingobium pentaromativorans TaxID=205844 RepID=G6EAV5_9SPHN|nr:hypothetical protein JI59_12655 [Novosphingobium pentaromativorans US6-1]EHJ61742.1 hypothetical protein NSU_1503 [Novosphingobium pentaromativorans US6-1]